MSYVNLDELNHIFTREGHQEAIAASDETPDGFPMPFATPAGGQTPQAAQLAQSNAGIVSQNLQQDPDADARWQEVQQQAGAVINENQMLRTALQRIGQQTQAQADAQWQAQFQATTDAPTRERMMAERFQGAYNALQQQATLQQQQAQAALTSVLVDGFTRDEVFGRYPNLTPAQQQIIRTEPDPDRRALLAQSYQEQQDANRQVAASSAAAIHIASGAGRVSGASSMGAGDVVTADGRTPGRAKSALEILRETPYTSRPF